ncbi:MAG: isoprenylcysteine carboxylmethyltransferase family protein [Bacteroidota bacterium]
MINFKIALLIYVLIYNGLIIIGQSYFLYKKTGINPFNKMGRQDAQGFNEKVLIFGACLIPVIAIVFAFFEKIYFYFVPIEYLEISLIKHSGLTLAFGGLGTAFIGQLQMGNSWRTGIDKKTKTALITHGLFKYSRNPIYLALLISLLGFFLMAPNAVSLCCLVLAYPSVEIKIRFEEMHLEQMHGKAFYEYQKKVRRWV